MAAFGYPICQFGDRVSLADVFSQEPFCETIRFQGLEDFFLFLFPQIPNRRTFTIHHLIFSICGFGVVEQTPHFFCFDVTHTSL